MRRPETIIKAINAWLDKDEGRKRGDARVYTKQEWRDRHEPYGNDAICTLVIDGSPLYDAFNYGTYGWKTAEDFGDLCHSLGCWYELGFAWSVHIYYK